MDFGDDWCWRRLWIGEGWCWESLGKVVDWIVWMADGVIGGEKVELWKDWGELGDLGGYWRLLLRAL